MMSRQKTRSTLTVLEYSNRCSCSRSNAARQRSIDAPGSQSHSRPRSHWRGAIDSLHTWRVHTGLPALALNHDGANG